MGAAATAGVNAAVQNSPRGELHKCVEALDADVRNKILDAINFPPEDAPISNLVFYSSRTPDKEDFRKAITCTSQEYNWETVTADDMVKKLGELKAQTPGKKGFQNICFACHGPITEGAEFEWKLAKIVVVTDPDQLTVSSDPARQVLMELAQCTIPDGRVDLLACSLLATDKGKKVFSEIQGMHKTHFAGSDDLTGNPSSKADWTMESDGVDISKIYFGNLAEFEGTFRGAGAAARNMGKPKK